MNTRFLSGFGVVFLVLILIMTACASVESSPTATVVPSATLVQATSTPNVTATPAFVLECSLVKIQEQQARPANEYGVTGEVSGLRNMEVDILHIDIMGESGQMTSNGSIMTEDYEHGNLTLKINDEWTYSDSKNVYKIVGALVYKITDLEARASYDITITGGGFGTALQTCENSSAAIAITPAPNSPSTPMIVPPMPTFQVLGDYDNPVVQVANQQGVETSVEVSRVETGDRLLDQMVNISGTIADSLPLKIAEGIHILIPWRLFRRAYVSEDGCTVTLVSGQELKGQLEGALIGPDNTKYDLQSINTMVLAALSKSDVALIPDLGDQSRQRWQLHVLEPMDRTFIVTAPLFVYDGAGFEIPWANSVAAEYSEEFNMQVGDELITTKLSRFEEITLNKDAQIMVNVNDVETISDVLLGTPGQLFLENGVILEIRKSWYLRMHWIENGLDIVMENPICILSKGAK